tara:strand:- start:13087 stop:14136 length:1050 start_codon:yes stop_codon:yes gene_type:complete
MGSPISGDEGFGGEEPMGDEFGGGEETPSSEKPFDDEPFDAGVEADEEDTPEKYIQQLSGKLGQSLRKYTEDMGAPDYDLEKFAINSVLSATNSGEMDQQDQSDIIQKVKSSTTDGTGKKNGEEPDMNDGGEEPDMNDGGEEGNGEGLDLSGIDMEEAHNPNPSKKTVFQDSTLGVKDEGMEENKYLNLENTSKSSIIVDNIKKMLKESLTTVTPQVKPQVKPAVSPTRRSKPYKIIPEQLPDPNPKAEKKKGSVTFIKDSGFSSDENSVTIKFDVEGAKDRFVANFVNSGEVLSKPEDYDEPWVYAYETENIMPNGKQYYVEVEFYGNPQTNLDLIGFTNPQPEIMEV